MAISSGWVAKRAIDPDPHPATKSSKDLRPIGAKSVWVLSNDNCYNPVGHVGALLPAIAALGLPRAREKLDRYGALVVVVVQLLGFEVRLSRRKSERAESIPELL